MSDITLRYRAGLFWDAKHTWGTSHEKTLKRLAQKQGWSQVEADALKLYLLMLLEFSSGEPEAAL